MSSVHRAPRPRDPRRPRRQGRGFSLIETLAVVAILAILAAIVGAEANRTFKRQKLASAASDIQQLAQRAYSEMQRRNVATFLRVGPVKVSGSTETFPIDLIADNGATSGAIDGTDTVIQSYVLKLKDAGTDVQQISLSTTNKSQVASAFWSDNSTDRTKVRVLMCDLLGRAIDPVTTNQIAGVATLAITHADMLTGTLAPKINYELRINPLWNVTLNKVVAP